MTETVDIFGAGPAEPAAPKTLTILAHDPKQFTRAADLLVAANTYVIDSDMMAECCAADLAAIKALDKALDEKRFSITKPMDAAKQAVMDLFRPASNDLKMAESILKKAMARWIDAKEVARKAAQAIADKAAAEEQARLQALSEAAADAGNVQEAADIQMQAALTTVAAALPTQQKIGGISSRKVHKGTVTDAKALIAHIVANETLFAMNLITINEGALNRYIASTEGKIALPGVTNTTDSSISSRSA